jgi:tetratricopeptide (TPR) repeat protein
LFTEGREVLDEILRMPQGEQPTASRARAAFSAGAIAYRLNGYASANPRIDEAIRIFRALGDRQALAGALLGGGAPQNPQARSRVEEAASIWAELGDESARDYALNNLATIAQAECQFGEARAILEPLVHNFERRGDTQAAASALSALGDIARAQGDPRLAQSRYEEALKLVRALHDPAGVARVLSDLGDLNRERGSDEEAERFYLEALREAARVGRRSNIARLVAGMAQCAAVQSRPRRALMLAAAATALWRAVNGGVDTAAREAIERLFEQTRTSMDPSEHRQVWSSGQHLTVEEVLRYAFGEAD